MVFAVIGIGFVAGFINTLAGGGSSLTLPLLMFLGLHANVANGTNRVAILMQNIVAVNSFRRKKVFNYKTDYKLAIPTLFGSIVGALIAVEINEALLEKVIGVVMVLMLFVVLFNPNAWVKEKVGEVNPKPSIWQYILFFIIGIYGGFIHLGVGFMFIAALVLGCGYDLVKTNAIKLFIVLVYGVFTLAIFMFNQQVDLLIGVILGIGNMLGAFVGVHFTVKGGAKFVRVFLMIALLLIILKLFGAFDFILP